MGQENESEKFFTEWEETFESFDQMGLHENLLRGIYAYGEALSSISRGPNPIHHTCMQQLCTC